MKFATFTTILFVASAYAANAQQLTLLPQTGFENASASMQINSQAYVAPLGSQLSPKLGARLNYQFRQGHGPFVGISTDRSVATVNLSNPENGIKIITSSPGNMRLYAEGGYQLSSKPIYFTKSKSAAAAPVVKQEYRYVQKRCGGYSIESYYRRSTSEPVARPKEKGWYVSVQPLVGAAIIPAVGSGLSAEGGGHLTNYKYQAGNWNSALIAGTGLEFGKNVEKKFTITVNYLKGLGNLNTKTISTTLNGKTTVSNLNSNVSSWNLTAGIPITLYNKKAAVKHQVQETKKKSLQEKKYQGKCGAYKSRCNKVI